MDSKIRNYYANNHLYSRKMIMPATSEKFKNSCQECKYYVEVVGHHETRKVCLVEVKAYQKRHKRVPANIEIMDLILLLGKEKLESLLGKGGQHLMACGEFEERI
ncbi:hypothetical protein JCM14036_30560 [Desulfotomaculum defluvii]